MSDGLGSSNGQWKDGWFREKKIPKLLTDSQIFQRIKNSLRGLSQSGNAKGAFINV